MKKRRDSLGIALTFFCMLTASATARADEFDICRRHDCSNDAAGPLQSESISGDEAMRWDPIPGWEFPACPSGLDVTCTPREERRCYEVALHPEEKIVHRACEASAFVATVGWIYSAPSNYFFPYRVARQDFPRFGVSYNYKVRACFGTACSEWSPVSPTGDQDYVEFVGTTYACIRTNPDRACEVKCYPGAQKLLPGLPDCF